MGKLLIGFTGSRFKLLTWAGPRPLLLECPPELRPPPPAPPEPEPMRSPEPLRRTKPRVDPDHLWQDEPPPPPSRPRPPDKFIDPRTVFKRRGAGRFSGTARRSQPSPSTVAADEAIHDFIIIPGNPAFRAAERGVKSLVNYLRTAQILTAVAEKATDEGTTIDLLPDEFSHLAFVQGQAPPGAPSILQGTLWFGPQAEPLPFGDDPRKAAFRLEIVGARFARLAEGFVARFHQILYLRPQVVTSPHDPGRLRGPALKASAPIPHFDVREED